VKRKIFIEGNSKEEILRGWISHWVCRMKPIPKVINCMVVEDKPWFKSSYRVAGMFFYYDPHSTQSKVNR